MLALHCCIFSIATITAAIAAAIVGAEARIALAPLCLLINKVIISEPERRRLEVALLALGVHSRAAMLLRVGPVDRGRAIVGVLIMAVLTLMAALPSLLVRRVDDLELGVRLLVQIIDSLLIGRQLQLVLGNTLLSADKNPYFRKY